eukprot:TRINITY_DN11765_c0_g1_i2.p1 TRINITY_DN11765_c0_g1~~TRINITY_DN11765_c0_g1_i2.p1  ORF type:complete len:1069 (+),score=372.32 TRINITY_DN11765_c0_g1_i2:112-3318(+)
MLGFRSRRKHDDATATARRRRGGPTGDLLAAVVTSALLPVASDAALSILPHQSDAIVKQLRSTILVDERDLIGPLPPTACSSLDDGPFCAFGAGDSMPSGVGQRYSWLSSGQQPLLIDDVDTSSSQFVVDGVLSQKLQAQNGEAFDWSMDTHRTFSQLLSRIISETITSPGGGLDGTKAKVPTTVSQQASGSRCFRIGFQRVSPGLQYLPADFSAGLPAAQGLKATWTQGVWEIEVGSGASLPRQALGLQSTAAAPAWHTQVVVRSALAYVHFSEPVVIRRLLVGLPAAAIAAAGGPTASSGRAWGKNAIVCGRLNGKEQWCSALEQLVTESPVKPSDASGPLVFIDIGKGIKAVNELAFIAVRPEDGLRVALLEVGATLSSHPRHHAAQTSGSRKVVVLKRHASASGSTTSASVKKQQFEPVLMDVSPDAALWDLNDMLAHNMQLRTPEDSSASTRKSAPSSSKPAGLSAAAKAALGSFQSMLRGVKANLLRPPPGVTFARIKKELAVLVKSTNEIHDEDVLLHSKLESLLQQRLRERSLDALIVLQAEWQTLLQNGATPGSNPALEKFLANEARAKGSAKPSGRAAAAATPKPSAKQEEEEADTDDSTTTGAEDAEPQEEGEEGEEDDGASESYDAESAAEEGEADAEDSDEEAEETTAEAEDEYQEEEEADDAEADAAETDYPDEADADAADEYSEEESDDAEGRAVEQEEEGDENEESKEEDEDDFAAHAEEALGKASEKLAKKSAQARKKFKNMKEALESKGGMSFSMDLNGKKAEMRVMKGSMQEMMKEIMQQAQRAVKERQQQQKEAAGEDRDAADEAAGAADNNEANEDGSSSAEEATAEAQVHVENLAQSTETLRQLVSEKGELLSKLLGQLGNMEGFEDPQLKVVNMEQMADLQNVLPEGAQIVSIDLDASNPEGIGAELLAQMRKQAEEEQKEKNKALHDEIKASVGPNVRVYTEDAPGLSEMLQKEMEDSLEKMRKKLRRDDKAERRKRERRLERRLERRMERRRERELERDPERDLEKNLERDLERDLEREMERELMDDLEDELDRLEDDDDDDE